MVRNVSWSEERVAETLRLIAEMHDNRLDLEIGEMFGSAFDDALLTYALRPGIMGQRTANHLMVKNQLLQFAFAWGWPDSDPATVQPGDPLRRILNDAGVLDVVDYAMQKVWAPEQFTQADLERWMQEMQDLKR